MNITGKGYGVELKVATEHPLIQQAMIEYQIPMDVIMPPKRKLQMLAKDTYEIVQEFDSVKEAEEFAEQDAIKKEKIDVKNEAESLIFQADKLVTDLGDKVSEEDKTNIKNEVEILKAVNDPLDTDTMSDSDLQSLKLATETFSKFINDFSEKLYNQASQSQPNSSAGPDNNEGSDNNEGPIEGEFTEK